MDLLHELVYVRDPGDLCQIINCLSVRACNSRYGQTVSIRKDRSKQNECCAPVDLKAVIPVVKPHDGCGGTDRTRLVYQLMPGIDAACSMMIKDPNDMGILHAIHGLCVFAVIDKKYVFSRGVLKDRRRFNSCLIQDERRFIAQLACYPCFCLDSEQVEESRVCNGAADRIRIRVFMAYYIYGTIFDDHILDTAPVGIMQGFFLFSELISLSTPNSFPRQETTCRQARCYQQQQEYFCSVFQDITSKYSMRIPGSHRPALGLSEQTGLLTKFFLYI